MHDSFMKTGAIGAPCHDDHNDIKNQKWSKIDVMGFGFARQSYLPDKRSFYHRLFTKVLFYQVSGADVKDRISFSPSSLILPKRNT